MNNEYILTEDMKENTVYKSYIVELPSGMYWRGNDAKPVKTSRCAALVSRKEGLAMCEKYNGCILRDAPRSRNC